MVPFLRPEPPKVYVALVAALFTASLPLAVMSLTFVLVGIYISVVTRDPPAAVLTMVGSAIAAWKIVLHLRFRRASHVATLDMASAARWEWWFAVANILFATVIGGLAARSFIGPEEGTELLATGMLFGFCSGQVARVAVRPQICSASIVLAAVPVLVASAVRGDVAHLGLATMFALFVAGGLESVRYAYREARQRIAMHLDMANIASVDPLTGLDNRLGLSRASADLFRGARAPDRLIGVHCFDLDGFKAVNDLHGHSAGDALLVELARRVRGVMRAGDVAARVGGDEFVVLQAGIAHPDEVEMFARRLCRAVSAPYEPDGRMLTVGTSIGSCTSTADDHDLDALLVVADRRMYQAKRAGGGVCAAA